MDRHCQQAILDNHRWKEEWTDRTSSSPPHIFGDLKEQVPHGQIKETLPFRARAGQVARLPLCQHQYCYTHGVFCQSAARVDFEVAGLPCQDNSRANQNRRFFEGNHGSVYLAWARRHSELQTPLILVENTPDAQLKKNKEQLLKSELLASQHTPWLDSGVIQPV